MPLKEAAAEWASVTSIHGPADFLAAQSSWAKAGWALLMGAFFAVTIGSRSWG